jgi:hypothetical protein
MRVDLDKARIYNNGVAICWKGSRTGQKRDVLKEAAKKLRHFSIKKTKIQSACVAAWCKKNTRYMLFITFTFAFEPTEDQARKIWDLMLNSLRNTYNVNSYVWVKERQKSGRLHYHIIIDRNRVDIKAIQATYNSAVLNICPGCPVSTNSVRLGNKPIIYSVASISRYLSKYISKEANEFEKRACGWSDLSLYTDLTTEKLMELVTDKAIYYKTIHVSEMFSVYYLQDFPKIMHPPPKN